MFGVVGVYNRGRKTILLGASIKAHEMMFHFLGHLRRHISRLGDILVLGACIYEKFKFQIKKTSSSYAGVFTLLERQERREGPKMATQAVNSLQSVVQRK